MLRVRTLRVVQTILITALLAGLAALAPPAAAGGQGQGQGQGPGREVTVMTRNLYFGADLGPLLAPGTPEQFQAALLVAFAQAQGSRFDVRMDAVADEIDREGAVLVGMQEVATWTVDGQVVTDFTQLILDGLADRGLGYDAVAVQTGFQFAAPIPGIGTVGLAIADVILARTDLSPSQLKISNPTSGTYQASVVLPTPLGALPFPRQWVAVDAKVRGRQFRFVSTHLESLDVFGPVRQAQATELLTAPDSPVTTADGPVVLVGDLNAEPDAAGDAAAQVMAAGFVDAWAVAGSGPGSTFGHDADLADPADGLDDARIDYVTVRGGPSVVSVDVVDTLLDPSPAPRPLWPSDHGGVVATLQLMPSPSSG